MPSNPFAATDANQERIEQASADTEATASTDDVSRPIAVLQCIRVRPVVDEDLAAVAELYEEVDGYHRQAHPDIFKHPPSGRIDTQQATGTMYGLAASGEADSTIHVLVAEVNNEIVGFLELNVRCADPSPVLHARAYAHVSVVAVRENLRGRGIGKTLMQAAEQWAIQMALSEMELNVWEFNSGARALYEGLGYQTLSRRMRKKLG